MAVKQFKKALSWFHGRHNDARNLPISSNNVVEEHQIQIPGGLEGIRQRMAAMGHGPIGSDSRPAQVIRHEDNTRNNTESDFNPRPESNHQRSRSLPKPRRKPVKQSLVATTPAPPPASVAEVYTLQGEMHTHVFNYDKI
jgi:hypothetical protein